jgi:hypothetical protein
VCGHWLLRWPADRNLLLPPLEPSCAELVATSNNDIGDSSGVERICLHEIELQPGVEPEEYERVFAEEIASSFTLPGWKIHLLKGERGTRDGKYLVLLEIESLEARDRYFPRPGEESEEFTRFLEQHPEAAAAFEKWQKMGPYGSKTDIATDYVALAE